MPKIVSGVTKERFIGMLLEDNEDSEVNWEDVIESAKAYRK